MHLAIYQIKLDDGRSLYVMRPNMLKPPLNADPSGPPDEDIGSFGAEHHPQPSEGRGPPSYLFPGLIPRGVSPGLSLLVLVVVLFMAIALGAYPFVRRLTRRLETLKRGVEAFGQGALDRRVPVEGRDEVATLATSFNLAAERVEALVRSHKSLLANASHELRSPLARLKMATSLLSDAAPDEREREHLRAEINTDIAELDGPRRRGVAGKPSRGRTGAGPSGKRRPAGAGRGGGRPRRCERRRHRRQRARRGAPAATRAAQPARERASLRRRRDPRRPRGQGRGRPRDPRLRQRPRRARGPYRERIFEPFFRLPGHAERAGGVGLGLALVRQIVERHHGKIRCVRPPEGGGCFVISLPAAAKA